MQKTYHVIGLMSGTSLDGLDIAYCRFDQSSTNWKYKILFAETITYSKEWKNKLQNSMQGSALDFVRLDIKLGELMGEKVQKFIQKYEIVPDFIASHGHTVFHQPEQKFTAQIGNGASLAANSHLNVICDFRSLDVALGGQGAPLVPIGDKLLFGDFDYCLNLGGIANISMQKNEERIAYDICPANMVLNALAQKENQEYDKNGNMARSGGFDKKLFEQLNKLPFYSKKSPKSLGREWVEQAIFPILVQSTTSNATKMATFCHHIAHQISNTISSENTRLLITGGGAFNSFLVEKIKEYLPKSKIHLPDSQLIEYKEALIFAFLGVLRWERKVNCLSSVTAAKKDTIGGAIYLYSR
jgi:anhydro-N-acetylmuramic acid kinase